MSILTPRYYPAISNGSFITPQVHQQPPVQLHLRRRNLAASAEAVQPDNGQKATGKPFQGEHHDNRGGCMITRAENAETAKFALCAEQLC